MELAFSMYSTLRESWVSHLPHFNRKQFWPEYPWLFLNAHGIFTWTTTHEPEQPEQEGVLAV
jgi:hypothetical protein